MLTLTLTVHDQLWPRITITVARDSWKTGKVVQQEKQQYDLAYGKVEEMLHNHARLLVQEILDRHQRSRVGVPVQGQ